jgi:hypothetical protein
MWCVNCKTKQADHAQFCTQCGAALPMMRRVRLAPAWAGYLIAAVFVAVEVAHTASRQPTRGTDGTLILVGLVGWAYWLFCVYRLHTVVHELKSDYDISPGTAAFSHLIPFYNLYWVFRWTNRLAEFVNGITQRNLIPHGWIGVILLFGVLLGRWDGSVSELVLFSSMIFLNARVREAAAHCVPV